MGWKGEMGWVERFFSNIARINNNVFLQVGGRKVMDLELKYYNQKEIWDAYSKNINETARAKEIVSYVPDDAKTVLDIGCGNGIVTNMINKEFVLGMDFAIIPLRNVNKNAIRASIDSIPLKENKFDLIIMTEVLEHLSDQIYTKAVQEINRLKAKYLLITVPFEENLESEQCKCGSCGFIFNASHHYRRFSEQWYVEEFPDYDAQFVKYSTYKIPLNPYIIQLKHQCGLYSDFKNGSCPKCGGRPSSPQIFLRYAFGGMNILDSKLKSLFRIQKPYHQIVLLMRK